MRKKWIKKSVSIIFITFLLLCFFLTFSSKLTGLTPQIGGYQVLTILSGSMEPTIKPGSLILIKLIDNPQDLHVDDIITFYSPRSQNELITHRIVDTGEQNSKVYFTTKGDANLTVDNKEIEGMKVYAKYKNIHIPYIGYLLETAKTKMGFVIFFLIPVMVILLSSISNFRLPLKRKQISFNKKQICSKEQVIK